MFLMPNDRFDLEGSRTTIDNKFVRLYDWKTSARMFERQPLNGPVECRSAFCRAITRMFRRGIAGVLQFVSLTSLSGKPFLLVVPLFVFCRFAPPGSGKQSGKRGYLSQEMVRFTLSFRDDTYLPLWSQYVVIRIDVRDIPYEFP